MTTQFLSRVDRDVNLAASSSAGPGSYQVPSSISTARPGFAPFASTSSKNQFEKSAPGAGKNQVTPAPYQVPEEVFKVTNFLHCFPRLFYLKLFFLCVETSGNIRI
jgi:hypothetical protein